MDAVLDLARITQVDDALMGAFVDSKPDRIVG